MNHNIGSSIESEFSRIPPLIPDPTLCRIPPLIPIEYPDSHLTKNGFHPSIKLEAGAEQSEKAPVTNKMDHLSPVANNSINIVSFEDALRKKNLPIHPFREFKKEELDDEVNNGWDHLDPSNAAKDSSVGNRAFSNAKKNDDYAQNDNNVSTSNETKSWEKVLITLRF